MTTDDDAADRTVPLDLVAIIGIVLLSSVLTYWSPDPLEPVRTLLGLGSVLFAPGYVTIVSIVRKRGATTEANRFEWVVSGLGRLEWGILSILTSVAIVSVLGLFVSVTDLGITRATMVVVVNGYTALLAVATAIPVFFEEGSVSLSFDGTASWAGRLRNPPTGVDAVLNLSLVFVLVVGGLVIITPAPGQNMPRFTEFYLPAEPTANDSAIRESLFAVGPDETERIQVGITNHEHRRVNYTVIVQIQRAEVAARRVRVLDRRQISRFGIELDHNESIRIPYDFTVNKAESGCRVAFLLYTGNVPQSPTVENSYRELHLWHTATPPDEGSSCPSLGAIDAQVNRTAMTN